MSLKSILACLTKADLDFSLIDEGDKIAIGVSGGKDSMLLLKAMKQYQRYPFKQFDFYAIFLDLGFGNVDIETLKKYCQNIEVELHIEDCTDVYKILSQHKNSSGNLPCSICSRMKKAAINKVAHKLNCNKVAFAHHVDDAIETLLMNTIYGGKIATFAPKMYLSETGLTFIRPFILCREKEITSTCKKENIPIIKSSCPNDHVTMREDAKMMLNKLYKKYPTSYNNYKNMLMDKEHLDIWINKIEFPIYKHYRIKECCSKFEQFSFINIKKEVYINEYNLPYETIFNPNSLLDTNHNYIIYNRDEIVGTISYTQLEKEFIIDDFALLNKNYSEFLIKNIILYIESTISMQYNPCSIKLITFEKYLPIIENLNYEITKNNNQIIAKKTIKNAYKFKLENINKK